MDKSKKEEMKRKFSNVKKDLEVIRNKSVNQLEDTYGDIEEKVDVESMSAEDLEECVREIAEIDSDRREIKAKEGKILEDIINESEGESIIKDNGLMVDVDENDDSDMIERKNYVKKMGLGFIKKLSNEDFDYSYDENSFTSIKYEAEPINMMGSDFEAFMKWAVAKKTSDVFVQTEEPITCDIYGKKHKVTKKKLTNAEMIGIIVYIYRSESALSILNSGHEVDCRWEISIGRNKFLSFRVNITSHRVNGVRGYDITLRTIPGRPPLLEDMDLPAKMIKFASPKQGLVLIAGATGSGKSTFLASYVDWRARDPDGHNRILTYEKPIEFVYDGIYMPTTIISQVEIGEHLASFQDGVVNALRRKPDIILVGELRDKETIGESITASMTGHLVLGTVHATSVSNTILRMVNTFSGSEKEARAADILNSIHLIIAQKLLKTVDGKRVAVREFLVFSQKIKEYLSNVPISGLILETQKFVEKNGQTFITDITNLYIQGVISKKTYDEELITLGYYEDEQ